MCIISFPPSTVWMDLERPQSPYRSKRTPPCPPQARIVLARAPRDTLASTVDEVLFSLTAFGLGLSLLLGIGFLFVRDRRTLHLVLAALFASLAFSMLPSLLHLAGRLDRRVLLALAAAAQFCPGPLFYFYALLWSGGRRRIAASQGLHLLPAALPALLAVIYFIDSDYKPVPGLELDRIIGHITPVFTTVYLALATFVIVQAFRREQAAPFRRALAFGFLFAGGYTLTAATTAIGLFEESHAVAHAAVSVAAVLVALNYLVSQRHPLFAVWAAERAERARAEHDPLKSFRANELRDRLEHLMLTERPYLDEDLSLGDLAREMRLSPHQLSYLLNEIVGENFYAYINWFRVQEACRLLAAEPDRTILSIAMAVGFNAKSSFHTAFVKTTGETPGAYRARVLAAVN